jgi:hypothetical protein
MASHNSLRLHYFDGRLLPHSRVPAVLTAWLLPSINLFAVYPTGPNVQRHGAPIRCLREGRVEGMASRLSRCA